MKLSGFILRGLRQAGLKHTDSEKGKTLLGVYWLSPRVQRGRTANVTVKGMAGCTPQLENEGEGIFTGCLRRKREKQVWWAPHSTGASERSLCVICY